MNPRRMAFAVASAGTSAGVLLLSVGVAWGDAPSDTRATFHSGNVTTCSGVGLPNDVLAGSPSDKSFSDGIVTGTVTNGGKDLQVSVPIGVTVDAIVVKGGNGYNVYSKSSVLPPNLPPPQNYISPLTTGGQVPTISHWFVCYGPGTKTPVGALGGLVGGAALAVPLGVMTVRSRRRRRAH